MENMTLDAFMAGCAVIAFLLPFMIMFLVAGVILYFTCGDEE